MSKKKIIITVVSILTVLIIAGLVVFILKTTNKERVLEFTPKIYVQN